MDETMLKLFLTLTLATACGGALAQTPETDPAELVSLSHEMESSIRTNAHIVVGAPDPCVSGPNAPPPEVTGNIINAPAITGSCDIAIGLGALQNATTMDDTIATGRCSGASLQTESRDLLIGDYTSAPRDKSGFVNIANKLCFWRDTGTRVACPPPEPECVGRF
jgi:hypothetical protein